MGEMRHQGAIVVTFDMLTMEDGSTSLMAVTKVGGQDGQEIPDRMVSDVMVSAAAEYAVGLGLSKQEFLADVVDSFDASVDDRERTH